MYKEEQHDSRILKSYHVLSSYTEVREPFGLIESAVGYGVSRKLQELTGKPTAGQDLKQMEKWSSLWCKGGRPPVCNTWTADSFSRDMHCLTLAPWPRPAFKWSWLKTIPAQYAEHSAWWWPASHTRQRQPVFAALRLVQKRTIAPFGWGGVSAAEQLTVGWAER